MGTLPLSTLRDEIQSNLGNREDSDPVAITTRINRLINLSQENIAREHSWRELSKRTPRAVLISTVDESSIDLSITNLRKLHSLVFRLTSGAIDPYKLVELEDRQWDELIGKADEWELGIDPVYYRKIDNTIFLYPEPTRSFILDQYYTIWPTTLSEDDDTSDLDQKDDLIIADTTRWLFESMGQLEDAARWERTYDKRLAKAIRFNRNRPDLLVIPRGIKEARTTGRINTWADPFFRKSI